MIKNLKFSKPKQKQLCKIAKRIISSHRMNFLGDKTGKLCSLTFREFSRFIIMKELCKSYRVALQIALYIININQCKHVNTIEVDGRTESQNQSILHFNIRERKPGFLTNLLFDSSALPNPRWAHTYYKKQVLSYGYIQARSSTGSTYLKANTFLRSCISTSIITTLPSHPHSLTMHTL